MLLDVVGVDPRFRKRVVPTFSLGEAGAFEGTVIGDDGVAAWHLVLIVEMDDLACSNGDLCRRDAIMTNVNGYTVREGN